MCDCSLTSMALEYMPYVPLNMIPNQLDYNLVLGEAPIKAAVSLMYDTISWVCGLADGKSYCGSTGSPDSVDVTFTDKKGILQEMPYKVFDWDGSNMVMHASDDSLVGTHEITMFIRVAGQPNSEARSFTFKASVVDYIEEV